MPDEYPSNWDSLRKETYRRDSFTCQKCGARGGPKGDNELHAHHIVPKSKGGSHNKSNLKTLCKDCHHSIHASESNDSISFNNPFDCCPVCNSRRSFKEVSGFRKIKCVNCRTVFSLDGAGWEVVSSSRDIEGYSMISNFWKKAGEENITSTEVLEKYEDASRKYSYRLKLFTVGCIGLQLFAVIIAITGNVGIAILLLILPIVVVIPVGKAIEYSVE